MISQPGQNSSEAPVNCVSGLALETSLTTLKSQKNRQICKMAKQADCNSVAFGCCRFKSCSADLYAVVPQMVEELSGRQWAGNTGLQVRILCAAFQGDVC